MRKQAEYICSSSEKKGAARVKQSVANGKSAGPNDKYVDSDAANAANADFFSRALSLSHCVYQQFTALKTSKIRGLSIFFI